MVMIDDGTFYWRNCFVTLLSRKMAVRPLFVQDTYSTRTVNFFCIVTMKFEGISDRFNAISDCFSFPQTNTMRKKRKKN